VQGKVVCGQEEPRGGTWRWLLKKVRDDAKGAVTIETVLIIAVIALPVLLFFLHHVFRPEYEPPLSADLEEIFREEKADAN
jgi:hypothetical protein